MIVLFKNMKFAILIILGFCVALTSCRTSHTIEGRRIINPDHMYSLCDAKQAKFSLIVDFNVKGITKRKETYHFPRVMVENDIFKPAILCCCADGDRGGYILSYGVWAASNTGIIYNVSCLYTIDGKQRELEKNIFTAWFEPKQEDSDDINISLKWKRKQNNKVNRIQ